MSAAAFIAKMGISRLGKIGDQITTALVQFDPETASQVQIDDMATHCQQLSTRISQAEPEEERTHKAVLVLEQQLGDTSRAAKMIGDQLAVAQSDTVQAGKISGLNTQLNTLMDLIEKIGGPELDGSASGTLFEARQDHAQAEGDLHEWQTVHAGAVESLSTARKRLETARHDMERAAQQEARAQERQSQASRDAGLKQGLDTQNVALSAMEQAAAAARQRARAATINADALKASIGTAAGSAEDIVKQTLAAAATAAPTSALDRLARLNKAA